MKYLLMCLLIGAIAWTLLVPPEKRTDRLWRGIARYVALATVLVLLVFGLALEEMSRYGAHGGDASTRQSVDMLGWKGPR
jgi:heme/copper-type cytochrome/quinol oxidase subunit 2